MRAELVRAQVIFSVCPLSLLQRAAYLIFPLLRYLLQVLPDFDSFSLDLFTHSHVAKLDFPSHSVPPLLSTHHHIATTLRTTLRASIFHLLYTTTTTPSQMQTANSTTRQQQTQGAKTVGAAAATQRPFNQKTCAICLERYTQDNPAILYSCRHAFHFQCAEAWFLRSAKCPVCDRNIRNAGGQLMAPSSAAAANAMGDSSDSVMGSRSATETDLAPDCSTRPQASCDGGARVVVATEVRQTSASSSREDMDDGTSPILPIRGSAVGGGGGAVGFSHPRDGRDEGGAAPEMDPAEKKGFADLEEQQQHQQHHSRRFGKFARDATQARGRADVGEVNDSLFGAVDGSDDGVADGDDGGARSLQAHPGGAVRWRPSKLAALRSAVASLCCFRR